MEYLADFILFLAKTFTLIGGVVILVALVTAISQKARKMHKGHLEITRLNEHYEHLQADLKHALLDKAELKKKPKSRRKRPSWRKKPKRIKSVRKRVNQEFSYWIFMAILKPQRSNR